MRDGNYWDTYFERPKVPPTKVYFAYTYQDPLISSSRGGFVYPTENFYAEDPEGFHDGPACSRLAVVDINSETGGLRSPAQLMVHSGRGYARTGEYRFTQPIDYSEAEAIRKGMSKLERETQFGISPKDLSRPEYEDDFIKVSAFATILATLAFVERDDVLGRRVGWGFDGKQLLLVPRAGWMDNAFYHRESRSIQLFSFTPDKAQDVVVHTALSSDIVVHETTHAVIDGIAPDLYDTISPQSLAIHEAVADFTAVLFATKSWEKYHTLEGNDVPRLDRSNIYTKIAEQFGTWRGHGDSLRDAWNEKSFVGRGRASVEIDNPHSLSEVLTGALYHVLQCAYENRIDQSKAKNDRERRSLLWAIDRLGSLVYQGLEWLPPGEVSFADFGRAMLVADEWRLPGRTDERQWLLEEFSRRAMTDEQGLDPGDCNMTIKLPRSRLKRIIGLPSDARRFAEEHRKLFGIPKQNVLFRTRVRLIEPKQTKLTASRVPDPVLLVKVAWPESEPNRIGKEYGTTREIWRGTTLAISAHDGRVIGRIEGNRNCQMTETRNAFLRRLVDYGILLPPGRNLGLDGKLIRNNPEPYLSGTVLNIRGGFRTLHIASDSL